MIGYTTVGSNDLPKAWAFYDELLASINAVRIMEMESFVAWGTGVDKPMFAVTKPNDGNEATVGNGVMIALSMESVEQVQAFHAKALSLGGADEGAPGHRGDTFYGSYFRDLDGNKLCAFTITA